MFLFFFFGRSCGDRVRAISNGEDYFEGSCVQSCWWNRLWVVVLEWLGKQGGLAAE